MLMLLVALSILTVGCGTTSATSPAAPGGSSEPPQTSKKKGGAQEPVADAAPDFTVETFTGQRFSLGEQRGTPVVLNFWESW